MGCLCFCLGRRDHVVESGPGNPLNQTDLRQQGVTLGAAVWESLPVDVRAVVDSDDVDDPELLVDRKDDAVLTPTCSPEAFEFVSQRLGHSPRVLPQRSVKKLIHSESGGLRKTARWSNPQRASCSW